MAEYKKLKYYFDKELAQLLAKKIKYYYKLFNDKDFIKNISEFVNDLELKDRVELITDNLRKYLPDDYEKAVSYLQLILGPENPKETGMFTEGYWLMPVAFFVEKYGLENFDVSIKTINEITKRHTGEYTVRPFLEKYPVKMLNIMKKWSKDSNVHVRRLACEGVRPRLPWHRRLKIFIENPKPILAILENLKEDESKFVQKSVANCLNDILKDNYEIAMKLLRKWSESKNRNTKWIIKHALRNEIKRENQEAMALIKD
ncbi:MAG: 3-methyladenine DNA glycosylase [Asgard group archaeon]|nr:3-methyladenine DNA glycosylase [Asgard group archaeon]